MREPFLSHWRGILLSLIGIVATIWLAFTDQLGLYIHPRYFVFTTVMAVVAAVFTLLAFAVVPTTASETEPQGNGEHSRSLGRRGSVAASAILIAATSTAMLVVPPATLTTATVEQREMNGYAATGSSSGKIDLVGTDNSALTVKDWAGLLRQSADLDFLRDQVPTVVGFITPDTDDPENVFYVARFVITCCAVDAQPVGVPVYLPGWQEEFAVDDWISVSGDFVENPSIESMQTIVIDPTDVAPTEQPSQPYVY